MNITEKVETFSPYDFDGTLAEMQSRISRLINQYGPDARIDWNPHHWYDYDPEPTPRFEILKDRPETADEQLKRLQEQDKKNREQEERERAELARLQAKFNK